MLVDEDAAVDGLAALSLESFCNAVVDVVVAVVVSVVSIVVGVAGSVNLFLCVFSVEEFLFETRKLALLSRSEARYFSLISRILSLNNWASNLFAIFAIDI